MTEPGVEFALVGRIRRAHGIRGELVVEPLTDAPDAVFAPGRRVFIGDPGGAPLPGGGELRVETVRPFKEGLLVRFDGIADRTAAEPWRDRTLLLPLDELEAPGEGELFIHDLVGMRVEDVAGEDVGTVREVFELPQGLVLEIQRPNGTAMLPWREEIVRRVDDEARVIYVDPPAGLFD